jgi:two-component system, chemotaxis family, protein-glutamate methylesterase/glutaminase
VVRKHLADLLTAGGIEVIATASDPLFAWPKMAARWPDVVVLDVEMPRMDGISFLRKIMAERPTPVVMCSTLTAAGAQTTMQALAEGAVAFVTKPKLGLRDFLMDPTNGLVAAVRAANVPRPGAPAAGGPPGRWRRSATHARARLARRPPHRCPMPWPRPPTASSPSAAPPAACRRSRPCSPRCRARRPASSSCSTCRRNSPPPSPSA